MVPALNLRYFVAIALAAIAAAALLATRSHSEASTTVHALAEETHFHGIAVDPSDPARLYLATHHGLYAVAPDGSAERLAAAIWASSLRRMAAGPGASSPRAWAARSTSTRWT